MTVGHELILVRPDNECHVRVMIVEACLESSALWIAALTRRIRVGVSVPCWYLLQGNEGDKVILACVQ